MILNRTVVDARSNNGVGDKTSPDRQRFIRRAKQQIKDAVKKAISEGNIKSLEQGKIKVPVKDMNEPQFEHDPETGSRDKVVTGNKDWVPGDTIPKPEGGSGGSGSGEGSPDGDGEDEFSFALTPDEFYDFLFEDLALPDLLKKSMKTVTKTVRRRSGFVISGTPAQLDIKQTYKFAFARHKALGRPTKEDLQRIEDELAIIPPEDEHERHKAVQHLIDLENRLARIPLIDDLDLRYRNYPPRPEPITKAVMFCLMDVSGSMDEERKGLAKRFFLLLYVWLMRQYNRKVELVFIRHHSEAEEVDEQKFFYDRETGGTVVSPALTKMGEIIRERYSPQDWNIYGCYASDGDNWSPDNKNVVEELTSLMPSLQYFAYLQVAPTTRDYGPTLWDAYETVSKRFSHMRQVVAIRPDQVWLAFKELFTKGGAK